MALECSEKESIFFLHETAKSGEPFVLTEFLN
jgi:hypothetical protein